MNDYYVFAFNTCTKHYEKVNVTQEVYTAYMRSKWDIENDDKSFYAHQIQFSVMIGHSSVENFQEFMRLVKDTQDIVENQLLVDALYRALGELTEEEFMLIYEIYFQDCTERECAENLFNIFTNERKNGIME